MGDTYKLNVKNDSTRVGNVCIYQQSPDVNIPGILTLAWLSKRAHPDTLVTFEWTVDYTFVWSEQGTLQPKAKFKASQNLNADLKAYNQVSFDYADGAFTFSDQTKGPRTNSLYVMQGPNIAPKKAHVGIGMSGAGSFVVPCQPNVEAYFTPHPKYYVLFGDYEQGEVIDITQIGTAQEVTFVDTEVSLRLNEHNLWVAV
jgi:hypothetical protein